MINEPPPFKGLNIKIPIVIPIKGRGFINHVSGLVDCLETLVDPLDWFRVSGLECCRAIQLLSLAKSELTLAVRCLLLF